MSAGRGPVAGSSRQAQNHNQKEAEENCDEELKIVFSKELFVPPQQPQKIKRIEFSVANPEEISNCGEILVHETKLYKMPQRTPHEGSVLDPRLGVSNKREKCTTCEQKLADCNGHFGYIRLHLPLFHLGFLGDTVKLLQAICKTCSRVLLPPEEKAPHLRRARNPRADKMARRSAFEKVLHRAKQCKHCPYCGAENGIVKRIPGVYKIFHDKFKGKSATLAKNEFATAIKYNDEIDRFLPKIADDLNPLRTHQLFERIPDEDLCLLNLASRPEHLLISTVPVPPVCIRPSVEMEGVGSNEDDITMKLLAIVEYNTRLRVGLEQGLPASSVVEIWDAMQIEMAVVINSDVPGLSPMLQPQRKVRGYVQRLKGKNGRFRGNLCGKRVDFSGRTVISPDPNLGVHEVAVPKHVALTLTYPQMVNQHNMEDLQARVLNGYATHPGANTVVKKDGTRFLLKHADRRRTSRELQIGDIVERHLSDGDVVLFNRQPSLHRISIMAHRAKVRPWRTLRFNECVCNPYNADFDGDEMNLHLPQTEEARTEATLLMGTVSNICVPKSGEVMICATQDFLTCAFLLTSKDTYFTRAQIGNLCCYMMNAKQSIALPQPAILKPAELWTGKQLFDILIRPTGSSKLLLNFEIAEKNYSRSGEEMCPNDGYVRFYNSQLICGRIGKVVLGGAKGGLFGILNMDYKPRAAAECMNRLAKLSARFMGDRGFSIGIDDVTPSSSFKTANEANIRSSYEQCQDIIKKYKEGALMPEPGMNVDQTLEAKVMGVLNEIRTEAGKLCLSSLHYHNSPLIMSLCGSKGSPINIAQMVACVGQQSVNGARCFNGFPDRTLPHFPKGDKTPQGKGFVANSFYSGLTPTEFFFHTMAGREGLVDTAVKTAETGYMSRRLMKALEDLYVHYDYSVRDASSGIVQFTYGDDALDPLGIEGKKGEVLDFTRMMLRIKALSGRGGLCKPGTRKPKIYSDELFKRKKTPEVSTPRSDVTEVNPEATDNEPEVQPPSGDNDTDVRPRSGDGCSGDTVVVDDDATEVKSKQTDKMEAETEVKTEEVEIDVKLEELQADVKMEGEGAETEEEAEATEWLVPLPADLKMMIKEALNGDKINDTGEWCSVAFWEELKLFLFGILGGYKKARQWLGLTHTERGDDAVEYAACCHGITRFELEQFIRRVIKKYEVKKVDPGTCIGALGAQSIGEPGTQMTLKTFHFAGVASMQVTQGVPRIKEIINGSKAISTPIMDVPLEVSDSPVFARLIKGRLERTLLGQVASHIKTVLKAGLRPNLALGGRNNDFLNNGILKEKSEMMSHFFGKRMICSLGVVTGDTYISILLDMEAINSLQLGINAHTVQDCIATTRKAKVKAEKMFAESDRQLFVYPTVEVGKELSVELLRLEGALPKVIVSGIPTIERTVIHKDPGKGPRGSDVYKILAEGTGLTEVMGVAGVVGTKCQTNHIMECEQMLGIEVARSKIISEIEGVMGAFGMDIDHRHSMLLADCMTYKGQVLGITRVGITKMKDSVLHAASFEKTTDHLFDAAIHGRVDAVQGVSESIIMGIPMPTGTGMFKILYRQEDQGQDMPRRPDPIFITEHQRSKKKG
ncbi:hypothetical protein BSKO_08961 [Bryopsis sp. KO-2023]|nr:hypothetical protein BSKO_08961 [Bryopsis sp. KO-2023]